MSHLSDVSPGLDSMQRGEPAWNIALLFPTQGAWTEEDYLTLNSNRLVEFDNGFVEVLPMPTLLHQLIVKFLFTRLDQFVIDHASGTVLFAPLPVRLWQGKFREPDIVFLRPERMTDLQQQPEGADLAVEVVSPGHDNRRRDLEIKPSEYAKAGVAEYWIVDPENQEVSVLVLDGGAYRTRGAYGVDNEATSQLLEGFHVSVKELFAVEDFGDGDYP